MRTGHWARLGAGAVVLAGGRAAMEILVEAQPDPSAVIASMRIAERTPSSVSQRYPVAGQTPEDAPAGIEAMEERGFIRGGFRPRNVPFSYYNDGDDLVGFDVEMAEALAEGLGVAVEFIPFRRDELAEGLSKGYFDVAMSGLAMDTVLMQKLAFSRPVLELDHALVAPDHMVKLVDSIAEIVAYDDLTVAYVEHENLVAEAREVMPNLDFQAVEIYEDFFGSRRGEHDVLFTSAEAAHAWTLFYPDYGVAVYNRGAKFPAAYAVASGNTELLHYVDNWIDLMRVSGVLDRHYERWILGKGAAPASRRWSIIHDVLGWVEE